MIIIRKLGRFILSVCKVLWTQLPKSIRSSRLGLAFGRTIFKLVELRGSRSQLTTTYFLRNRSELAAIRNLVLNSHSNSNLFITVIGCSLGAEVYSILYTLKDSFPLNNIKISAYDIDHGAIEIAKAAEYPSDSRITSLLTKQEIEDIFDFERQSLKVKEIYRNPVTWIEGDPTKEPLISIIPKQDIVVANRFLFHMDKDDQQQCINAISTLLKPNGYLSISGADINIRTKIAKNNNWKPITDDIESIHAGDISMTIDWPFQYWGLEPIDKHFTDWKIRYCSIFQLP